MMAGAPPPYTAALQQRIDELKRIVGSDFTVIGETSRSMHQPPSFGHKHNSKKKNNSKTCHKFTLRAVLCRCNVDFHITFSVHDPSLPPDVVLPSGVVGPAGLEFARECVRAIANSWDVERSNSLCQIANQLLSNFRSYQCRVVDQTVTVSDRVKFEISSVQEREGFQCLVQQRDGRTEVSCLVPLQCERLRLLPINIGKAPPSLYVRFAQDRQRPVAIVVDIPNTVRALLGAVETPIWVSDSCLLDFVPQVERALEEEVDKYLARRAFIAVLIQDLGHPTEYDTLYYRRACFSFVATEGKLVFPFVCRICLPPGFPHDQPIIHLYSIMHERSKSRLPMSIVLSSYPWKSSRDFAPDAGKKLRNSIDQATKVFMQMCSETEGK